MTCNEKALFLATIMLPLIGSVQASPHGTEFGITQHQVSGGMSGAGSARPQDVASMVFGNPSTLTQQKAPWRFDVSAAYLHPEVSTNNDGANPFMPATTAESSIDTIILPSFSFSLKLSDQTFLGAGFSTLSGLLSDYRQSIPSTPLISALQIHGFGLSLAHQVNSNFSLGINSTFTGASFQFGLASNSASVTDFGLSTTFGFNYHTSNFLIGGSYRPSYSHTFKGLIETTPSNYSDFKLEQPMEAVFSVSSTSNFSTIHQFAFDVRWKNWADAEGYSSLWQNQEIFSLGYQKNLGNWQYRFGFSQIGDLIKPNNALGNTLGSVSTFNIPTVASLPVSPPLLQLLQATTTNGYWKKHLSTGLTKKIQENTSISFYIGYSFDGKENISPGLSTDAKLWSLGSGISWKFY